MTLYNCLLTGNQIITGNLTLHGDLLPDAAVTRSLGSGTVPWLANYFRRLYYDGTNDVQMYGGDLDFKTVAGSMPDLDGQATCTKANETYAQVKVEGTVKRILCYDDA